MKRLNKPMVILLIICLSIVFTSYDVNAEPIIDADNPGSINIHKYAVEDMNDYNTPATGELQTVELPPIPNITFTVTRVQDDLDNVADAIALEDDDAYYNSIPTDENGLAKFSNLAHGTYLVHEDSNPAVLAPVEDFLVSIPMTNPNGDAWIYDVHVYPKNELVSTLDVDIFVTELNNKYDSLKLQSQAVWFATSQIPADIGKSSEYRMEIHLDEYLTYTDNSLLLYYGDIDNDYTELVLDEEYTITSTIYGFDIELTTEGRTALEEAMLNQGVTDTLHTEFKTLFHIPGTDLPDALAKDIACNVILTYTSGLGFPYSSQPMQAASIYTGGFHLLKVDGRDTDTPLAGAAFKIYPSLLDANSGTNALTAHGSSEDWQVTTLGDGIAVFYGLSYGGLGVGPNDGATTYYLVETQAPSGYNLLKSPQPIMIDNTSHLMENEIIIENYTGFTLPVTGGMGTIIITITGILLMILAFVFYFVANKRKYEE